MLRILEWLRRHKYPAHSLAFLAIVVSAIALYSAARAGATGWIWFLIGVIVLANLIAVLED
jgi:hypothetical protein